MRIFFVVLVACFLASCQAGFSQLTTNSKRAANNYYLARELFNARKDHEAVERLLQAISIDRTFIEAYLLLGEVYDELEFYKQAVAALESAISINPDFFPNTFYNLGNIHLKTGDYENAQVNFRKILERSDISEKVRERSSRNIERCEFAIHAMNHPVPFNPINMGDSINTIYDEYWPSLTADEEMLVFTRQVLRNPFGDESLRNKREDFYYSIRKDREWLASKELGPPINTDMNEGAQSLSVDGRTMYFTACNRDDGKGSCDIYFAVKEGNQWGPTVNLGSPVNTSAWEAQPSISPDGRTLYFVSSRDGSTGGMDLWKSKRDSIGNWTNPVNLGDVINTTGDEMSPFIHADNRSLYFSSTGHLGMGGFDIFKSKRSESGEWSEPVNLGYPINTHHDEIGMIVNAEGSRAYYSSDRMKDSGKDLYMFDLHEEARPVSVSYMKGVVYDSETRRRLGARFELIDINTSQLSMQSSSDPRSGEFLVTIPTNRDYALNVSRPGYLFFSEHFSLQGISSIEEPYLMDIPLKSIKSGEKVILRNIFFAFDSSELLEESFVELEKLTEFLNRNPTVRIRINGHTDIVGTDEYNQQLSDQRALSVVRYLNEKGIQELRLESKGFGSSMPLDTNETPEGRARNRRTEFEVL